MNTKTRVMITVFAAVAIGLLLLKFHKTIPLPGILITLVVIIALYRAIPSKFDPNFFTLEIMFGAGFALAVIAQNSLLDIPSWTMLAWIGLSVVISVFCPLPLLLKKFSDSSFH